MPVFPCPCLMLGERKKIVKVVNGVNMIKRPMISGQGVGPSRVPDSLAGPSG